MYVFYSKTLKFAYKVSLLPYITQLHSSHLCQSDTLLKYWYSWRFHKTNMLKDKHCRHLMPLIKKKKRIFCRTHKNVLVHGTTSITLYQHSETLLTTERNNQLLHVQKRSYYVPHNTTSKLLPFKVNPMAWLGTKPGGHNSSTHMVTTSIYSWENDSKYLPPPPPTPMKRKLH